MNLQRIARVALVLMAVLSHLHESSAQPTSWKNGLPSEPSYFPIAVWLQEPKLATDYQKAGINLYVGLWKGPTEQQLQALEQAKMPVLCSLNEYAQSLLKANDPLAKIIVGWQQEDEPDNAQRKAAGGYGPPTSPEAIIEEYRRIHSADATRPVILNLGQGVAWEGWRGRGVRTGHLEDYPQYAQGGDIVSFDIYPVTHKPPIQGELWYVAQGVQRLVNWTNNNKPVWAVIEAARINSDIQPTAQQIRTEVWMALIHGARGLMYFVHEWKPRFNSHALLDSPETLRGVTAINQQIRELAPALNSPTVPEAASLQSTTNGAPVAIMAKKHDGKTYIFAVAMRAIETDVRIAVASAKPNSQVEVIGEDRTLALNNGVLGDHFAPYEVHLYRVK